MVPIFYTIIDEVTQVLAGVDEIQLIETMNYIKKDRRIFVAGEGRSGLMAKSFAMRLMHLGYNVYVVGETITPSIKEKDLLLVISGSGESSHSLDDARKAKKNGAYLLSVTSHMQSSIASISDCNLIVPGTIKSQQGSDRRSVQLLSSLFDQSIHLVLDALCLMISKRDGLSNEEATSNHW